MDTDNIKEEGLPSVNPINEIPQCSKAQAWQLVRQCVAEMLGTGLLSFAALRMTEIDSASLPAAVVVPSSLALAIWLAGPISGGHVNPSVTLALTLCRIVYFVYLPIYWAAQFAGAFAGSAIAHAFLDGSTEPLGPPSGNGTALGSTPLQVLSEYLASTIFITIVLVSADSRRPDTWSGFGFNSCLAIGLMAMVNRGVFELSVTALDPGPLPNWRRGRGGQFKTWLDTARQEMEVVLGPWVFGLRRWRRERVELSRSAAADHHAWRGRVWDVIEAG
nr:unnamed protein product [Spirometra erinaceieuropaei]